VTKIMGVVDCHGLPAAIGIACGQRHESKLVRRTLEQGFLKALPERLIGDTAYHSPVHRIEMISPHNRRTKQRHSTVGPFDAIAADGGLNASPPGCKRSVGSSRGGSATPRCSLPS
jgi:hypothetical protein